MMFEYIAFVLKVLITFVTNCLIETTKIFKMPLQFLAHEFFLFLVLLTIENEDLVTKPHF